MLTSAKVCKSPRELSPKFAHFLVFCLGGGGGCHVACGARAGRSVFTSAAGGVRTSTCYNATHEKPQACETSPPYPLGAQPQFQDVGQEVRCCHHVPSHQEQAARRRWSSVRTPARLLHVPVPEVLFALACTQAVQKLPLGFR